MSSQYRWSYPFLVLLLLTASCGQIPTPSSQQAGVPSQPTPYPPPPTIPTRTPDTSPTPAPTVIWPTLTPMPTPVQPTPYAPQDPLPTLFPVVVYAMQRPEQAMQLWKLRYEQGTVRQELLLDLTDQVLESQIDRGHAGIGWYWPLSLVVSPDGSHTALTVRTWDGGGIFTLVVSSDGHAYLPLQPDGQGIGFLAWFPDGKRAVLGGLPGESWGVANWDGSEFRPFVGQFIDNAVVLPGDEQVVFATQLTDSLLNVVGADGTNSTALVSVEARGNMRCGNLILSPDGQVLAFTWDRKPQSSTWAEGQIWVVDANGANLHPLNDETSLAFALDWSPDGRTIAFVQRENPETPVYKSNPQGLVSSLWVIDVASGQQRQLLSSEGKYATWSLHWLPDGSGLVFLSNRGGESNLWFIRSDGTGLQQLTQEGYLLWAGVQSK